MQATRLILGEALSTRCAQVVYRCMEEVGSTKGALYLRAPDGGKSFEAVIHYGWPRGTRPPERLEEGDPLLRRVLQEKRSFVVNELGGAPELTSFAQGEFPRFLVTPVYLMGDWVGLLVQRDPIAGRAFQLERHEPPTTRICEALIEALKEFGLYGTKPKAPAVPMVSSPSTIPSAAPPASGPISLSPTKLPPDGQAPGEKLFGFENAQVGFTALPWERAEMTMTAWMSPPPALPVRKRGMVAPEQRAFFWEIAGLISQILSCSAVTLWVEDSEEMRPLLVYSQLPISQALGEQMLAHATFHLPHVNESDLRLISKVELEESPKLDGAFATYMPLVLNEDAPGLNGKHDLLMVFRVEDQPFTVPELEIIQRLGRTMALYLEEGRLHERYHHAFLSVTHRILKSGESRMPNLRSHSLATARLAREVALRLELPSEEVEAISIAAILHDVGMLMLDPVMMQKAELSKEEKAKVRQHPQLAEMFLKDLRFPFDVIKIIRHHHERWDGRGYPDGLRETSIPVGSRIIGLIEAYEVMTSGKSYKRPKGFRQVLDELRNEAGAQFDPRVVEAFWSLMTQKDGKAGVAG
jgi:putative nucleotidyltransferase with HDIG domain